jgi:hypothetical protein
MLSFLAIQPTPILSLMRRYQSNFIFPSVLLQWIHCCFDPVTRQCVFHLSAGVLPALSLSLIKGMKAGGVGKVQEQTFAVMQKLAEAARINMPDILPTKYVVASFVCMRSRITDAMARA